MCSFNEEPYSSVTMIYLRLIFIILGIYVMDLQQTTLSKESRMQDEKFVERFVQDDVSSISVFERLILES